MTWSKIPRIAGVLALASASLLICAAQEASTTAYVDGTITTIPLNTPGELNLRDRNEFQFRYGSITFSVPYNRITECYLGRDGQGVGAQITGGASKVGRTVLPMLFDEPDKYVTVRYRNEQHTDTHRLVFLMPANQAEAIVPLLREKTIGQNGVARMGAVPDDVNTWWGNQVWKTERNKHLWPSEKPQEGQKIEVASREE